MPPDTHNPGLNSLLDELFVPPSYTVEGRLGQRWWTWQRFAEHDDAARAIANLIEARRFDAIRLLETRHRTGRPPEVLRELFHYDPDPAAREDGPEPAPVAVPAAPVPVAAAPVVATRVAAPAVAAPPVAPPVAAPLPVASAPAVAPEPVASASPLIGAPAARAIADAFARMEAEVAAQEQRAREEVARQEEARREEARRAAERRRQEQQRAAAAAPRVSAQPDAWPALWRATVPVVPAAAKPEPVLPAVPVTAPAARAPQPAPRDAFDDTGAEDYAPLVAAEEPAIPGTAAPDVPAAPKPPQTWDAAEIDAAMAALRTALREVEAIAPVLKQETAAERPTPPQSLGEPRIDADDRLVAAANDDATPVEAANDEEAYWDEAKPARVAPHGHWRFRLRRIGYSLGTAAAAVLLAFAGYETTRLAIGLPDLLGEARQVAGALLAGPERPIVAAARRGDHQEVERLLKGGFSADSEDPQGIPVLLVAARAGHTEIVRRLLDGGADANRRFGQAETPLLTATREGLLPSVDAMLARGGQVNGRGGADDCETPLLAAAAAGRLDMVSFLLTRGATFDVLPGCKTGPLDAAAPHPRVRDALETAYQRRLAAVQRPPSPIAPAVATGVDFTLPPRSSIPAPPPIPTAPIPTAPQPVMQQQPQAVEPPTGYGALMYGLAWRDTLAEVKAKAKECRPVNRRFEVCTLAARPIFDDGATVEAWFDRQDGERFVSIETRSIDLVDYTAQRDGAAVRRRFDELRREIDRLVPAGLRPVVQRTLPPGSMTFFEGLKPDVAAGDFSIFWSDDNRRRPASVHLKLSGIDNRKGFWRIVVANPLRQTQQAAAPGSN